MAPRESGCSGSFPKPGVSVALDIPIRDDTQALVDDLNEIVIEGGGRIYLAKDALTRPDDFRRMEPRLDDFLRIKRRWDPTGAIQSAQSRRLFGHAVEEVERPSSPAPTDIVVEAGGLGR